MLNNTPDLQNKKRGLGRGLGSLLGGAEEAPDIKKTTTSPLPQVPKVAVPPTTTTPQIAPTVVISAVADQDRIWKIAVDKLKPGHYQPRQEFSKEALQELSTSIKSNGILQPIVARKKGDSFEIIAGERRWRAAQMAGLHEVPVILREFRDQEALELALVENIQREDLNPIEEAEAFQRLIQEFSLSQQQVADKVGKERATIANAVRLLALPSEVLKMITQKELSVGHAKVLLALPSPSQQKEFAKLTLKEKLSVRKLEKRVQNELIPKPVASSATVVDENVMARLIIGISEELQKILGTKVAIDYSKGAGKIAIQFYSDEEFSQMVERLKKI